MITFIDLLESIGNGMMEYLVGPLLIWTIIAVPVILLLNRWETIPPVYQYHGRIALLLALPLGLVGTYLAELINTTAQKAGDTTAFFVIQNPIAITTSEASQSAATGIMSPTFWIGVIATLLAAGTLFLLLKMIANVWRLKSLEQMLEFTPLAQQRELISNLTEISEREEKVLVAYSEDIKIPFTYGWRKTRIVIPKDLKTDPETLAMAVQHELMHIKHHDYLLNGLFLLIKSFFWYHPLSHHLYNSISDYREITCDSKVLANNNFSKKRYASLLVDLAEKQHHTNLAMSMAVNPSSLKKRIKIMTTQNNLSSKFRSSFWVALSSMMIIVLAISCTDIADNGITKSEVEQTQSQLAQTSPENPNAPLYFINGEQLETNAENNIKLARLKPKYIKSINVLKDKNAINKYGEKATNGVFEIQLVDGIDSETAFADLKEDPTNVPPLPPEEKDHYIAVENMPELIGGLASIQQKIKYPEMAQKAGIEGRVIVRFIVNEKGEVENPEVMKGVGGGCDEEALRVVKQAKFKPGMQRGEPVRVQYSLPISYKLPSDDKG